MATATTHDHDHDHPLDPSSSSLLHLHVRTPDGTRHPLDVAQDSSLADLRILVLAVTGIPEHRQKLVYAGRVLVPDMDDHQEGANTPACTRFGLRSGGTLYLVVLPDGPAVPPPSVADMIPIPNAKPPHAHGSPTDQLASAMSPMMDALLNTNPDLLHSMLMMDPRMRQLAKSHPDFGRMLRDPAFMRQMLSTSRNPTAMREMQRNQDRALANLETIPGGFMALQRMYNQTAGALDSALGAPQQSPEEEQRRSERLARRLGVERVEVGELNTRALPNPWAPAPGPTSAPGGGMMPPGLMQAAALLGRGGVRSAPASPATGTDPGAQQPSPARRRSIRVSITRRSASPSSSGNATASPPQSPTTMMTINLSSSSPPLAGGQGHPSRPMLRSTDATPARSSATSPARQLRVSIVRRSSLGGGHGPTSPTSPTADGSSFANRTAARPASPRATGAGGGNANNLASLLAFARQHGAALTFSTHDNDDQGEAIAAAAPTAPADATAPAASRAPPTSTPAPQPLQQPEPTAFQTQLQHMVDMGFGRAESARALMQAKGDLDVAVELVVAGMGAAAGEGGEDGTSVGRAAAEAGKEGTSVE